MDKIKKYIDNFFKVHKHGTGYEMKMSEIVSGINEVCLTQDANRAFKVVTTLFDFGYAKGYRAAKAEIEKAGVTNAS